MFQKIRTYFFSGLAILAPLFLTVLVVMYLVRLTDRLIVNPLFQILPISIDAQFKIILAKIIIAFFVLFILCVIGFLVERFIFRKLFRGIENILKSIPIFNTFYSLFRDIAIAFFGDKSGVFKRVVYVEYPRKDIYALGFVMQEKPWDAHRKINRSLVTVFISTPPNPATGYFVMVPKEDIIDSDLTVEQGIRLVMSGGAVVPPLKV